MMSTPLIAESPDNSKRPSKRRKSPRNTNQIRLADPASLHFRRLHELFFDGDNVTSETDGTQRIGQMELQKLNSSPNIFIVDDFLSSSELSHLLKIINKGPRFQKSFVGEDSHIDKEQRTSSFLSISKQHDKIISAIESKAAHLLGCWGTVSIEPLQLVRYAPGQFFDVHHDLGDYDEETNTVLLPPKSMLCKRRLVTIFCYLNTISTGGGQTMFPRCDNLKVTPKAGTAVVFPNVRSDGTPDERTIHAGLPPENEMKYGLNIWVCED